jgi:hypothetical protein
MHSTIAGAKLNLFFHIDKYYYLYVLILVPIY